MLAPISQKKDQETSILHLHNFIIKLIYMGIHFPISLLWKKRPLWMAEAMASFPLYNL
jgi:hypothetical protein